MIETTTPPNARGFSLVEALIALVIFLVVLAIVFSFFVDFGRSANTQSGNLDQQTAARITVDEMARAIQMCGYNIDRDPSDDPSTWQRDVVYAGSHAFAFNADIDATIGPIPPSVTVTFPTGDTYAGQGPTAATGGAETYVYTIDANDDGALTLADRSAAATGSFNPAADTPNPLDFALFKKTYGYNGTNYGGTLVPIAGGLFTNATSAVAYPDSTTPEPVFEYWLTEDIDRSQSLADAECVVGTCPPTTTRLPKQYLWGDTDKNGILSDAEKANIRDKPVGSPAWSGNPFATSGAYNSSTLTAALNPLAATPYVLTLASVAKMSPGMYVQIDTGSNTEYAVVENVVSASKTVALNADLHKSHAVGTTVQIMPQTLLRAVRAVKIQYDSIAATADTANGAQAAGRAGRAGTKGMDYQVRQFDKTVELTNLTTEPLETLSSGSGICPIITAATCAGADVTTVRAYFPSSAPTPLNFTTVDTNATPVSGVALTFSKTNGTGNLTTTTAASDSGGLASTGYTATAIGDSTVTATGTCIDHYFNNVTFTDTVLVKGTQLVATMTNDCLSTVSSRTPAPSAGFTVKAQDSAGAVQNSPISLSLQFDTTVLPSPPDYTKVQATLYVGGTAVGTTSTTGGFTPWTGDTGSTGILSGAVVLNTDTAGKGARVNLVVTAPANTCWPASGALAQGVTYLKLDLASANPSGCTETSPCVVSAGATPPNAVGTLSINSVPIQSATVAFTKSDFQTTPGSPAGSAVFQPGASGTTDVTGAASVFVANNGAASITASNPLTTTVDATASGIGFCSSPSIVPVSAKPKFIYNGNANAGTCDADMQAGWISLVGAKKGVSKSACMHVQNVNGTMACNLVPTGIKFAIYNNTSGTATLDATMSIATISGGAVHTTSTDCSGNGDGSPAVNSVTLFTKACNGNANLANNTQWNFKSTGGCALPAGGTGAGKYFELDNITFAGNINGPRKIVVTLYYGCDGFCSTSPPVTETWTMNGP
jgi:type II secretory pathway pseudopilin PulG